MCSSDLGSASQPIDLSDSVSGSSFDSSNESAPRSAVCRWRTAEYHDQECSRYFDCPSHVVDRRLSDDEGSGRVENRPGQDVSPLSESEDEDMQEPSDMEAESPEPSAAGSSSSVDAASPASGNLTLREALDLRADDTPTAESGATNEPPSLQEPRTLPEVIDLTSSPLDTPSQPIPIYRDGTSTVELDGDNGEDRASSSAALTAIPTQEAQSRDSSTSRRPEPPLPPIPSERRASAAGTQTSGTSSRRAGDSPDIVLPRWQPDAEVTFCPICHTQFSIFVRKHHCRYVVTGWMAYSSYGNTDIFSGNVGGWSATHVHHIESPYHTNILLHRQEHRDLAYRDIRLLSLVAKEAMRTSAASAEESELDCAILASRTRTQLRHSRVRIRQRPQPEAMFGPRAASAEVFLMRFLPAVLVPTLRLLETTLTLGTGALQWYVSSCM